MKAITDKHGIDYIITPTNEDNERQVEQMVGKAMCAYANAMEINNLDRTQHKIYMSEYEATVRCLAMFVDQPTSYICGYVIARCFEEYGI